MDTLSTLIDRHGVTVLDHHDLDELVPVNAGLQLQGDVAVVPAAFARVVPAVTPVSRQGVPVVRGENGGNTHTLLADGPVFFDPATASATALSLGSLTVPDGSVAYLAHPEHAYTGIAPGTYELRRQREQADELRLVAD